MKLVAYALTSGLLLTAACHKDSNDKPNTANEPIALSLAGMEVMPLADSSLDEGCNNLTRTLRNFQTSYLPNTTYTQQRDLPELDCSSDVTPNSINYITEFLLQNGETTLDLGVTVFVTLDDSANFILSSVYVDRISGPNRIHEPFVVKESDLVFGPNIANLRKTLQEWASPSHKTALMLGRPYGEDLRPFVSNASSGSERLLVASPVLRVELIASADGDSQGLVKFLEIDPGYFQDDKQTPAIENQFLLCPDLPCLNDGVTYKIQGDHLILTSKSQPSSSGGTRSKSLYLKIGASALN